MPHQSLELPHQSLELAHQSQLQRSWPPRRDLDPAHAMHAPGGGAAPLLHVTHVPAPGGGTRPLVRAVRPRGTLPTLEHAAPENAGVSGAGRGPMETWKDWGGMPKPPWARA